MKIICETQKLKLEYEQELVFLTNKISGEILLEDDFYGNATCGLIDSENNWAIIGGIHLTLWKPNGIRKYVKSTFKDIHSIRLKDEITVEILTDPWTDNSSIWELNIDNDNLCKIRDFLDYKNIEYTEKVIW